MFRSNPSEIAIPAGPRIKSLATQHLEYIAYALLDKSTQLSFTQQEDFFVKIKGLSFNLSAILRARPDFEQLHFSTQQLDAFYHDHGTYIPTGSQEMPQMLHPAEKSALFTWTNSTYQKMQALLNGYFEPTCWQFIFLSICIAAHALSKPLTNEKYCSETLLRGENVEQGEQRQCAFNESTLFMEQGFMAFAHQGNKALFKKREVKVRIDQEKSLNPIGKPIDKYSKYPSEYEVLFPPNTEFLFTNQSPISQKWIAAPLRSVRSNSKYAHIFSQSDLEQIVIAKIGLMLNSVQQSLILQKQANTHSLLRRFFFDRLDNDQELWCYSRAIVIMKLVLSSFTDIQNLNSLALFKFEISKAITEITYLLAEHPDLNQPDSHTHTNLRACIYELEEIKRHLPAEQPAKTHKSNLSCGKN